MNADFQGILAGAFKDFAEKLEVKFGTITKRIEEVAAEKHARGGKGGGSGGSGSPG